MHEVIPVGQVDLLVFQLHPDDLLHQLIAPLLHDLQRGVKLTVQDPQKDEALVREQMKWNPSNLAIGHGIVLKRELAIGEHEL